VEGFGIMLALVEIPRRQNWVFYQKHLQDC